MDEMFRMLGREQQADFDREAERRRLAKDSRGDRPKVAPVRQGQDTATGCKPSFFAGRDLRALSSADVTRAGEEGYLMNAGPTSEATPSRFSNQRAVR